jgi:pectate lyase
VGFDIRVRMQTRHVKRNFWSEIQRTTQKSNNSSIFLENNYIYFKRNANKASLTTLRKTTGAPPAGYTQSPQYADPEL